VGKLHRLNENAYGTTRLFHLSNVGVNAGLIVTKNSIIYIDAGMTVADGKSLLVQSIFQLLNLNENALSFKKQPPNCFKFLNLKCLKKNLKK